MPILNDPKRSALVVGGIGAAVCASVVAFSWNLRKKKKFLRKNSSNLIENRDSIEIKENLHNSTTSDKESYPVDHIVSSSSSDPIDTEPIDISVVENNMQTVISRGGRKNYRAMKKRQLNESSSVDSQELIDQSQIDHSRIDHADQWPSSKDIIVENGHHHHNSTSADIPSSSSLFTNCQSSQLICQQGQSTCQFKQQLGQQQTDAEVRATQLAVELSKKINLNCTPNEILENDVNSSSVNSFNVNTNDNSDLSAAEGFSASEPNNNSSLLSRSGDSLTTVAMKEHQQHSSAESPSLNIDGRSEGSQDSGKGASVGVTSSVSPVEELLSVEQPNIYEFEIPQNIVGLIIGRQGVTIKQITEQSGAQMIIRKHYTGDNHKICTIEGRREQINNCLRLIRRKFPPSRFPELKLTPLLPPPIISPVTPILDSVVRLSLPEGVKCEVVVSSLIEPDHFFVQQPTHPSFTSLARLDQYMLAVYNQVMGVPGLPRPIEEGVICAAPVMDGWFRAQTIEMYEDTDECLVKFVDYGGYLKIPSNDLRQIRSDFMTLPFQAIECTLNNVQPINENEGWSQESMAYFEQSIYGKIVDAYVKGVNPNCTMAVDLYYNLVDSNGQQQTVTINETLVENGFAKWIIDDVTNTSHNNNVKILDDSL